MIRNIFNNLSSFAKITTQELDDLQRIVNDPNVPTAQKFQFASQTFLPVLRELLQNGGDLALAEKIKDGHATAQMIGPMMAAMYVQQMGFSAKITVNGKLGEKAKTQQEMLARATAQKASLATTSEADMIAGMTLSFSLLPPRLKDFMNEITNGAFDDIPATVRKRRTFLSTHSAAEIADYQSKTQDAFPSAELEDFLTQAVANVTPLAASTFVETALKKMSGDECADAVLEIIAFAEKAMDISAAGGTFDDVVRTRQTKTGLAAITKILTAIEDSLVAANILPSADDLKNAFKAMPDYPKKPAAPKGPSLS